MPSPPAPLLQNLASSAFRSRKIEGENAPDLANALGDATAQGLQLFLSMAMVSPGTAAVVDPVSTSGATAGPGMLMPPPAGGPDASTLSGLAKGAIAGAGLIGEDAPKLGDAFGQTLAPALTLFTAQVQVAPGVAVAGMVTAAPGMLMGSAPGASTVESLAKGFLSAQGLQGEAIGDTAGAFGELIGTALSQLMSMAMMAPGVACTPAATAAPGRLM